MAWVIEIGDIPINQRLEARFGLVVEIAIKDVTKIRDILHSTWPVEIGDIAIEEWLGVTYHLLEVHLA